MSQSPVEVEKGGVGAAQRCELLTTTLNDMHSPDRLHQELQVDLHMNGNRTQKMFMNVDGSNMPCTITLPAVCHTVDQSTRFLG
mmetsp:Transcript_4198/g.5963  ORF Transcript_4198/g.5963 Transcript_4198/m.5963 type:complete len:84 (+) Transcript_4198:602-853(+)